MNKTLLKRYRILLGKIVEKIYTNGFASAELHMNAEMYEDVLQYIFMRTSWESFVQAMPETKKAGMLAIIKGIFLEFLNGETQTSEDIFAWMDERLKSDVFADVDALKILGEVICKNTNVGLLRDAVAIRGNGDERNELDYLAFARNVRAERTTGIERMYWSSLACAVAFGLRFTAGISLMSDNNLALGRIVKASETKGYSRDIMDIYGSTAAEFVRNVTEILAEYMVGTLLGTLATTNKSGAKERNELTALLYLDDPSDAARQEMDVKSDFDTQATGAEEDVSLEKMHIFQKNSGNLYASIWECPILYDQRLYVRQVYEAVDTAKGLEVR